MYKNRNVYINTGPRDDRQYLSTDLNLNFFSARDVYVIIIKPMRRARVYLLRVQSVGESLGVRPDNWRRLFFWVTTVGLLLRPRLSGRGGRHSIAFGRCRRHCGGGRPGRKLFVSARRVLDLQNDRVCICKHKWRYDCRKNKKSK